MAEKKVKAVDIRIDEKEPQVESVWTKESAQAHVDAYAKKSPEKYLLKKDQLKAWVNSL